ncbi:MAG: transcription antitermination factor NusB [Chitinophagaceae bacterium]
MQSLYTLSTLDSAPASGFSQQLLNRHFDQTRNLLVHLTWFLTQVMRYAEQYAHQKASKHLPTAEDLNINTKIAGNELLWKILEEPGFQKEIDRLKPEGNADKEFIRKIYLQLLETTEYQSYIASPEREKKEERKIMEFILNDLLLANPHFISYIEELFSNWDDDGEGVVQLLDTYLHKPGSLNFENLVDPEKKHFAKELLRTVIEKEDHIQSLIVPKLKNWEPERIAQLDMIMMKMGVAEFLYFETIPPKVTINEYIDLAKEYSTSQSGQFINGILDGIHKELVEQGKLQKTAYKK